ncbi:MAG: DUF6272 family protein [Bacteroidia bacterium]|nr:DUF6272 family protein [Bacteroidia bacterium]MDW8236030.1 DUF6272 family protein [Bacteroidia bacterium]
MIASQPELVYEPPLAYSYPLYRNMLDNSVLFIYHGPITPDLVVDVLALLEHKLDDSKEDRRVGKKLFNIMVESFVLGEDNQRSHALMVLRQLPYMYTVSMGRRIPSNSVYQVKAFLDWVNMLSADQLRETYQTLLESGSPDIPAYVGEIPSISILDLARKSGEKLHYFFEYLDDEDTFLSLEARIHKT